MAFSVAEPYSSLWNVHPHTVSSIENIANFHHNPPGVPIHLLETGMSIHSETDQSCCMDALLCLDFTDINRRRRIFIIM